jgi:hypothetical protein
MATDLALYTFMGRREGMGADVWQWAVNIDIWIADYTKESRLYSTNAKNLPA